MLLFPIYSDKSLIKRLFAGGNMIESTSHADNPQAEPIQPLSLAGEVPLCVDLDGTLILSDVLWESIVQLWKKPLAGVQAAWALRLGKAAMKDLLAKAIPIDPAALPYREDLLAYLTEQRQAGRRIILVTATHHDIAQRVAEHIGLFDDVMATEGGQNLGGGNKRDALVARYGERGFDYIGDHDKDLAIFSASRLSLLADPSSKLKAKAEEVSKVDKIFYFERNWLKVILKALRVHQWAKNALLGVPLITAHQIFDWASWINLILAFISFSLLASATYMVNDLHDLALDRKHTKKRFRPLASGALPIPSGLVLAAALVIVSLGLTVSFLPRLFFVFLITYTLLTLAYSFDLKRRLIVDALTLSILYTLRIIAGAAAINVSLTEWLLMFSLFFFVSLALLKRYIELEGINEGKIPGRGYMPTDIEVVLSIGPTMGLMSVLVLALYINSPAVTILYKTPQALWLLCLVLIYWITRIWFLAKRGWVHHDPIVFALMDFRSYVVAVISGIILLLASLNLQGMLGL
jgi:4-hydroxybenzoate polyprenyltransferase/phosphoserine phosphatase